jgi:hypothetical protein
MTNTPRQYTRAMSHGSIADEESCQGDLLVMRQSCASPMTVKGGDIFFVAQSGGASPKRYTWPSDLG